ncbi:type III polyketide synthase [Enhygromyxa salina]|uniref:Alpha-pyrone synthesis polyketide synthase-like Pks18 n=1 Tax=Enhygromyxa salina TaxID=215803 RepID=A0A2S9YX41_9BACT|nr:type III polyketide synthase [Enhygromyxa salina]PRQ09651.1 Alpha-pyrone synthesis polyketide synthase-like Pks18 [Enhygromyxa salina]
MTNVQINQIVTGVPRHDIHVTYLQFARTLLADTRALVLFERMAAKAQIEHRYSVLAPATSPDARSVDGDEVYMRGAFPPISRRMQLFERHAPQLAVETVAKLNLGAAAERITHVIVTTCTGMYAPGLDLELVQQCDLRPEVERTMVGFMGCHAAITGLRLAHHIVRSEPASRVLLVNLELCTLHLQHTTNIERMLSFLLFGDGCSASLISADPVGLTIDRFNTTVIPGTRDLITWKVRDQGFDMFLSGRVPANICAGLQVVADAILDDASAKQLELWAVHPGGRSILDAVERGLALEPTTLAASRRVLAGYGNMSSATVMFVLESLLATSTPGQRGCAMAFGPGLSAETMFFHKL